MLSTDQRVNALMEAIVSGGRPVIAAELGIIQHAAVGWMSFKELETAEVETRIAWNLVMAEIVDLEIGEHRCRYRGQWYPKPRYEHLEVQGMRTAHAADYTIQSISYRIPMIDYLDHL